MWQEQHQTNGLMYQNNASVRVFYTGILAYFSAIDWSFYVWFKFHNNWLLQQRSVIGSSSFIAEKSLR